MAHLVSPQNQKITLPVFFNLDGVVGAAPSANGREDVLFVQFCFWVIATHPLPGSSIEFKQKAAAVKVTGMIDAETVEALRATQEEVKKDQPGTVVDGRASPSTGSYGYGGGAFTIVHLNESVQHRFIDLWPRIDRIPGCPEELRQMVIRTVRGT